MGGEGYVGQSGSLVEHAGQPDSKVASGQTTPASGSATLVTGLSYVRSIHVTLDGVPSASAGEVAYVTATTGDQAGTPAAGSVLIKSWQDDFVTAATTGFLKVNWWAEGY